MIYEYVILEKDKKINGRLEASLPYQALNILIKQYNIENAQVVVLNDKNEIWEFIVYKHNDKIYAKRAK